MFAFGFCLVLPVVMIDASHTEASVQPIPARSQTHPHVRHNGCVRLLPCWEGGILRTSGGGGAGGVGIHLGNLGVRLGPLMMLGSSVFDRGLVVWAWVCLSLLAASFCAVVTFMESCERLLPFGISWALTGYFVDICLYAFTFVYIWINC